MGIGFRTRFNGRHEILEKLSKAFLFYGVGLADFFDGERISGDAAIDDPNVERKLFEPARSFEKGFFPISAEIGHRSAENFHGISNSLGDGVSEPRSDGDLPSELDEFAFGAFVELGRRCVRVAFKRRFFQKEFADSKSETRAEGFGESD